MSSIYKNTLWSITSIIGVQFINILTNIILARILVPEAFGILGMAMVFAGFAFVIQEAGLNSYLIYKKDRDLVTISTTFWLNVLISVAIASTIYLLSPFIAKFYNDNQVKTILEFICIGILVGSIGNTQRALLMKDNRFSVITLIDIIAEVISSIFAIIFAIYVNGLLAVSARYVVRPLVQSLMLLKFASFKIVFGFKGSDLKNIFSYSSHVLWSQLFIYMNNNVDYFLIGKYLGDRLLGIYTLAFQWGAIARYYLSGAIIRVLFPAVAARKDNKEELKVIYVDIISKLSFVSLPICVGMALVANEFIYIIYGEKWIEAVPVLKILLIAGGIASISVIGGPVLRGIGRPDLDMKLSAFSFISFTTLLIFNVKNGLIAVAFSELARVIIIESVRLLLIKKHLNIKLITIYRVIAPVIKSLLCMILCLIFVDFVIGQWNIYFTFILKIFIGVIVYAFSSYFFNREQINWIISNLLKKRSLKYQ
jgi:teichuronic acid exporter